MVRRARNAAHSTEGARVSTAASVDVVSGVSSSADEVVEVSSESDASVSPLVTAGDVYEAFAITFYIIKLTLFGFCQCD